ncbi:MAG TPA: G5 domain-containing protein [Acetivibrio clariflavus]|nr:G5 domain-containing protein [Acetivibrio clariflavus]
MQEQKKKTVIREVLIIVLVSIFAITAIIYGLEIQKGKEAIPSPDDNIVENTNQPVEETEEKNEQAKMGDVPQQVDVEDKEKAQSTPESENNLPSNGDTADTAGKDSSSEEKTSSGTSGVSQSKTVKNSQGKQETVYEITIETVTKDGKTQTKTYTSTDPNETFKFYDYVKEDGKIKTYEVTMTVMGKEVSRKLVAQEDAVTVTITELKPTTTVEKNKTQKTIYQVSINGYTRDGKPFSKTFESTNPDEVITYYQIEDGRFYEIKQNMRGDVLSKKEIKVDYTYKERVVDEIIEKYNVIEQQDETMEIGKKVVLQEGIDGITRIIEVEKYLFDVFVSANLETREIRKRQDKIVKVGTLKPLGNSGKVFSSMNEATNWANQQINDKNSKWYNKSFIVFPIDHTNKRYSVEFNDLKPGDGVGVGG